MHLALIRARINYRAAILAREIIVDLKSPMPSVRNLALYGRSTQRHEHCYNAAMERYQAALEDIGKHGFEFDQAIALVEAWRLCEGEAGMINRLAAIRADEAQLNFCLG